MKTIIKMLEAEVKKCAKFVQLARRKLAKLPEGRLKVSHRGDRNYFYHYSDGKYSYVKTSDTKMISGLASRAKYETILGRCERFVAAATPFLAILKHDDWRDYLDEIGAATAELADKEIVSDEEYARIWEADYPLTAADVEHTILTKKGDYVRSKSEKIIADSLFDMNIPYRYEARLNFGNRPLLPDFTILDRENRREIIWEHFGMLENSQYASHTVEKLALYAKCGYYLYDNLLCTFETSAFKFPVELIEKVLKEKFG